MLKKTSLGALVATASLLGLLPAAANAQQYTVVRIAPPAPVVEVRPQQPGPGHVWAAGHHEWRGNEYVWVPGQWMRERAGQEYREARWVERNGQWQMVGGDWVRRGPNGDRDGDGIANRDDRYPNQANNRRNRNGPNGDLDGDGIRNSRDRDRDGDGVPNGRDRFPDNARRS